MKNIYIQFAIDNWYDTNNYIYEYLKERNFFVDMSSIVYFESMFISKEFIEAIAKGLIIKHSWGNSKAFLQHYLEWEISQITINQAIAIRDWKLEEFIENLIK